MKKFILIFCCLHALSSCSGAGDNGGTEGGVEALVKCASDSLDDNSSKIELSLINVREIWAAGTHAAFVDLAIHDNKFYAAFREGAGHTSEAGNGYIRVISFLNDGPITEVMKISLDADLRDPKLLIAPNQRLYVTFAGIKPSSIGDGVEIKNYVVDVLTGRMLLLDEVVGAWLWRLTGVDNKFLGFAYRLVSQAPDVFKGLFVVLNEEFSPVQIMESTVAGECTLRQSTLADLYVICREKNNAMKYGYSKNTNSYDFSWCNLTTAIGGPNFLILDSDIGLVGGRFYGARGLRTSIAQISLKSGRVNELLRLPSGGDTGYPGMVLVGPNRLFVSYYSQPKGQSSTVINFAEVAVNRI